MKCADAIVNTLIAHGVDTIFGLPGAQTYELVEALRKRKDEIRFVVSRHEQGAAYMAFGYAKSTGKIGVYTVVPGPGVLNTTAALSTAHNTRVLCLTGQIPVDFIGAGHGMLHELRDQLATLSTLSKWSARINHSAEVSAVLGEAFKQLNTGRPQPVAIEVPGDVLGTAAYGEMRFPPSAQKPWEPEKAGIENAVKLIKKARQPMILAGSGAAHAGRELLQLAKMLQAPVVSFRGGRGIVSDALPYGFNCAEGYRIWHQTDLMIGIGTRLELPYFRWQEERVDKPLVRIDIDPTEMIRIKADVEIVADSKVSTRRLARELEKSGFKAPQREKKLASLKQSVSQDIQRIQPQMDYLNAIRDVLPKSGFLVEEISQVGFTAWYGFPCYRPNSFITSGYQGNLGHGFQTALGVKVGNPKQAVVSITGDGGFMFGVQELATAVQYNIALVVLLFNNNAYGNVRRDQINFYDAAPYGSDLTNPDFVAMADSFGAAAERVHEPGALKKSLRKAFRRNGPTLIEIPIETGSETSPWEFIMPVGYGK